LAEKHLRVLGEARQQDLGHLKLPWRLWGKALRFASGCTKSPVGYNPSLERSAAGYSDSEQRALHLPTQFGTVVR